VSSSTAASSTFVEHQAGIVILTDPSIHSITVNPPLVFDFVGFTLFVTTTTSITITHTPHFCSLILR